METNFPEWLLAELEKRNMTQAELARKSGVTPPQISRILSGTRGTEGKTLSALAHALKLPPEEVYRAAGLLPPEPIETKLTRQITYVTAQLPPEEQQGLLEFAKLRLRLSEKQGTYETRKPAKHTGSTK